MVRSNRVQSRAALHPHNGDAGDEVLKLWNKKKPDDASSASETLSEDDLRWLKDIEFALLENKWEDAELLLLKMEARTAETSSRLIKERDSLLEAWGRRVQGLPEQDRLKLIMDLRRMTFDFVTDPWKKSLLSSLRGFLNTSIDILVKLIAALLIAGLAGISRHSSLHRRRTY